MNKFFKSLYLLILPLSLNFTRIFSINITTQINRPENSFILSAYFENSTDYNKKVNKNSYIELDFDNSVLQYKGVDLSETESFLNRTDFKIEKDVDSCRLLKRLNGKEKYSNMPQRIDFEFKIKDPFNAISSNITAKTKSCNDPYEDIFFQEKINIPENSKVSNCKLKSLSSCEGTLSPEFNPDIQEYQMQVPCDTKEVNFNFEALKSDLSVKINRSKLNAAGKDTKIKIEVSDKELKGFKRVYNIFVKREPENKKNTSHLNRIFSDNKSSKKLKSNKTNKNKFQNNVENKSNFEYEGNCLNNTINENEEYDDTTSEQLPFDLKTDFLNKIKKKIDLNEKPDKNNIDIDDLKIDDKFSYESSGIINKILLAIFLMIFGFSTIIFLFFKIKSKN